MFNHLHVHSHFSLLDGMAKIEDLIEEAKKYKMKSLAITDHGVMYGVIEFYQKAKAAGIKPIIGVEVYLAPNGLNDKRVKIDERPYHLVLLAKDEIGYKNLIKLTSIAHLEGFYYKPRIDKPTLKKYSQGLIGMSACLGGEISKLIINNQTAKLESALQDYKEIFGPDNFYLEVQHHPGEPEQSIVNKKMFELSKKFDIPIVASNDCHYIHQEDAEIQDILLCLQTKRKKSETDNRIYMMGDDYSFRSPEMIEEAFKDHPEVIANTQKIVDACNLEIELGKTKLPYFALPEGETPFDYLCNLCYERLPHRYPDKNPEVMERLKYELSVIEKTGFASYFLIVQDFVMWAKEHGIVVGPGRGSAAGSIVSYILNITNIDPLPYGLVFERFLNPERISMPDIDLDFADIRRDEVIHYVENKYGRDHVAQIITFGTMAARAAVRDVGRVLDYPYSFCDKLAKMIPMNMKLGEALSKVSELKNYYDTNSDVKKIINAAIKLEGVARHASKHACGIVITPEPLDQYVPVQYDVSGTEKTIITQYEMHAVEALGLLKMDFLGLKNLTLIETALNIIKRIYKEEIDLDNLPLNDPKTLKLFQAAYTIGVFQFESGGMRRYLKQLKPTQMEDIIAMVALYRPGPMELIPDYIAAKNGLKEPSYLHPKLKPILENTYGIAVYQEQLLLTVRALAGFTLAEADVLRKAVGKKIAKLLQEQKVKFIKGCINNNVDRSVAERVWQFIEPFAGYGFNKSHATCYAVIAYQTAYLKANYPTEFMAALLTSDQNDSDRIAIEVEECKKMGLEVLPPDINESLENFTVVGAKKIRFGLLAIKNVGEGIVKEVIAERKANGAYQGLDDFLSRVKTKDLNKKSLESFIKSGSLDQFGERNKLLVNMEVLLDFNKKLQQDHQNGQTNLFGSFQNNNGKSSLRLTETEPAPLKQKLFWEKELLGLFVSDHPLKEHKEELQKWTRPINSLLKGANLNTRYVIIAGIITNIKRIITSNKQSMLFIKLEDESGSIEAIVFPKTLLVMPDLFEENKTILAAGTLTDKDGVPKIIVETAEELMEENIEKSVKKIQQKLLSKQY
ncbi:MAG: DNA polymerase III subunit alpha [Patescibacteria group bacterium]|nr:DNA polymerase III subunit alpha [Patescibacteria group bacterium]MDD5121599.1 DNA polymerase III subunit alpha [Patescibacteria group bacterium]MDD5222157.1 DNA polymerase III subunit alpha [Patescibacteria group bacterium]MDD5396237.1 DNA polymerase III subunit alpha [Patescibacteria group bacterium]